jgi:(p)ppGpp synthase/HD superfamily hydrolase
MSLIESAEAFARAKNADINFCKSIVFRLKSIGVNDEQVLCCAFLCHANSSFDEIHARFGREIATYVTSISKDLALPRQRQEEQYIKQLQDAPWESILIKMCEISANLKILKDFELSKTKRGKILKQNIHYLNVLKKKISENKTRTPGIERLLDGANETLTHFKQRPISF